MFRATGDPNTNPDTLQAFQRTKLRMLIANSDEIVPISNPNVEIDNEFDFVTSGRGGLYIPSDELKQYLEQFEYDFALYHNPSISLQENSIMIFANILKLKHPTLPMDMLRLYSKTRFFIRLKFLNNELSVVEKSMKRRYVTHINKFA